MNVSDVLARKNRTPITVKPGETVAVLSGRLRENKIGAAVVTRNGESIDGVVSERDLAHKLSLYGAEFGQLPVSAIMTANVICCRMADPIATVASTMLSRNIRHLPVVDDDGKLIGMVSMRDVVNIRIDELHHETALLRAWISESEPVYADRE